jgi:hypothetical protein
MVPQLHFEIVQLWLVLCAKRLPSPRLLLASWLPATLPPSSPPRESLVQDAMIIRVGCAGDSATAVTKPEMTPIRPGPDSTWASRPPDVTAPNGFEVSAAGWQTKVCAGEPYLLFRG